MKKPGCLSFAFLLAFLLGGGQNIYTALKDRNITEVSIIDFEQTKPSANWLKITNGELDVLDAAFSHGRIDKKPDEVIVPYVPAGSSAEDRKVHVLLKTKNPDLLQFVKDTYDMETRLGSDASEAKQAQAAIELLTKHADKLAKEQAINGLVEFGIDSSSKEKDQIRKLFPNLAPDFVVVRDGKKPEMGFGIFMLLAGCALGYFMFRPGKTVEPPPLPPTPPPLKPPPLPPGHRGA